LARSLITVARATTIGTEEQFCDFNNIEACNMGIAKILTGRYPHEAVSKDVLLFNDVFKNRLNKHPDDQNVGNSGVDETQ
jgi:hypothetical protein